MDFADAVRWLDGYLSRSIQVTISGPSDSRGNSGGILRGALAPGPEDFGLIDSRGGRLAQWSVGQAASFHVLEGDFVTAEVMEEDGDEPVLLIETREVTAIVAVTD